MRTKLLLIIALAVSFTAGACNFNELEESFDKAKDRAMYGNWCGPGLSGPGDPVDSLDSACKQHDNCYDAAEIPYEDYAECRPGDKRSCDQAFVDSMNALDSNSDNWTARPPEGMKAEAEQFRIDALKIFGSCVDIYNK